MVRPSNGRSYVACALAAVAISCAACTAWLARGNQPPGARRVPARVLPVPDYLNVQLRSMIARPIDGPAAVSRRSPVTDEDWRRIIADVNTGSDAWRENALRLFPAAVAPRKLGGVPVYIITPQNLDPSNRNRTILQLHGGAFVFFGGASAVTEGVVLAHYTRMRVISIDYRMPPSFPFPAALDDSIAVWSALLRTGQPENVGIYGSSAGGGLALSMVLRLKQLGMPLPGALAPGSPWSDLTKSSDSYYVNEYVDDVAVSYDGLLEACARLYAGKYSLRDPLLSPVYGDFSRFPPTILTTGTRDLFLSNTVRVYRKLRDAGVDARVDVYDALSHTQYLANLAGPDSRSAMTEIADFFDSHLGKRASSPSRAEHRSAAKSAF